MQNSNNLMEAIIECLKEEIKAIRETREMLLKKYPELFSFYTEKK